MITKLKVTTNLKEIQEYEQALREFTTEAEAKYNGYEKPEPKEVDGEFLFDPKTVRRAWIVEDEVSLDFGENHFIYIAKTPELIKVLYKRFKDEED